MKYHLENHERQRGIVDVLLTVHLSTILVSDQLNAKIIVL